MLLDAAARDSHAVAVVPTSVSVTLPSGDELLVAVAGGEVLGPGVARAEVVKDAGGDIDVTDGMTVWARVEVGNADGEPGGVTYSAGEGVGTVTREGLQLAVGEPAINPVPRRMIERALVEVLGEGVTARVTIGVLGGREVAVKTFNPRLGVEGGISIIGTSGLVEPKSTDAWMRSLLPQVSMARAAGHRSVWLAPGGIGERYAIEVLEAPPDAVVQCSNFVGALLDECARAGVGHVVLVGHAGKLVKVAAGLFDTHSRTGDARLETVAAVAAAEGAPGPLVARLLDLTTVQAAVAELRAAGLDDVWRAIALRASTRASARAGVPVDVVLLGYEGEVLATTQGATRAAAAQGPTQAAAAQVPMTVVGVGPGCDELLTPLAWRTIRRADVVVGGARLLERFAPGAARPIALGADIDSALAEAGAAARDGARVVVLASGDPSLYGVLASVRRELPDLHVAVVPGISSAQLALARLGESWEGVAVTSAHGRDPADAIAACVASRRTLVLVDRATPPEAFSAALAASGPYRVTVLERLGGADERVSVGSAEEIAAGEFDPLSVVFVESLGKDAS